MALQCVQFDDAIANVLPGGLAGTALSCGDLVYMDSSGNWQKAQSVNWIGVGVTRKDAVGVVTKDYIQYDRCNPVKVARFKGYSSLTVGGKVYLSTATAGGSTQTEPHKAQVRQVVGYAATATEVVFDVNPILAQAEYEGGVDELVFTGVAAASISQYDICGIDANGKIAKATAAASGQIVAVGIAKAAISADATGNLHNLSPVVTTGLTAGTQYWLHVSTGGSYQTTAPSTTNQLIQPVGIAIGAIAIMIDVKRYGLAKAA